MSNPLNIPAPIIELLEVALLNELGNAASEIAEVSEVDASRHSPKRFTRLLRCFDAHRGLLEAIGFDHREQQDPAEIDLDRHGWSLRTALEGSLAIERDYAAVRPDIPGASRQRRRAQRNAQQIEAFLTTIADHQAREA